MRGLRLFWSWLQLSHLMKQDNQCVYSVDIDNLDVYLNWTIKLSIGICP